MKMLKWLVKQNAHGSKSNKVNHEKDQKQKNNSGNEAG